MEDEVQQPGENPQVAERAGAVLRQLQAEVLPGGLYVVATPIGNLADITLRALAVLARASFVYCEDTRHSRTLLAHYGITRSARPYHEHNAEKERPRILAALAEGRSIALISDAGTPLVSDPGYKLVREAAAAGFMVTALPGASAVTAALAVAGLPTDTFLFAGFLPPRSSARQTRLAELKGVPATLVFFEAATRLAKCLADMSHVLGPREAVVARELTKLHEAVVRAPLPQLAEEMAQREVRGEIVVLVGPGQAEALSEEEINSKIALLLEGMSVRDAAKAAAETFGMPKGRAYELALALRQGVRDEED